MCNKLNKKGAFIENNNHMQTMHKMKKVDARMRSFFQFLCFLPQLLPLA